MLTLLIFYNFMAKLPLVIYPNEILGRPTKKITDPKAPEIQTLIFDMLETMKKNDGKGLAAPQVGHSLRLCVIEHEGKKYVLINPEITRRSWRKIVAEEGCLSFPGQFIFVKRHAGITVKAVNQKNEPVMIKAKDMLARVFQHEIDHLDGVLFTSREVKKEKKR